MDVHANDWSELAGRLANNYGEAFEPDRRKELRPKLVRILDARARGRRARPRGRVARRRAAPDEGHDRLEPVPLHHPVVAARQVDEADEQPGLQREHDAAPAGRHGDVPAGGRPQLEEADARFERQLSQRHVERPRADALDAPLLRVGRPQGRSRLRLRRRVQQRRQRDEQVRDLRPAHGHVDGDLAAARLRQGGRRSVRRVAGRPRSSRSHRLDEDRDLRPGHRHVDGRAAEAGLVVGGELGAAAGRHRDHRSLQQLAARRQVRRRREHVGERRARCP